MSMNWNWNCAYPQREPTRHSGFGPTTSTRQHTKAGLTWTLTLMHETDATQTKCTAHTGTRYHRHGCTRIGKLVKGALHTQIDHARPVIHPSIVPQNWRSQTAHAHARSCHDSTGCFRPSITRDPAACAVASDGLGESCRLQAPARVPSWGRRNAHFQLSSTFCPRLPRSSGGAKRSIFKTFEFCMTRPRNRKLRAGLQWIRPRSCSSWPMRPRPEM